ncbi:hypothetical protein GOP47_0018492 [Adiantum capillus-veneris]|uniref:Uncharacterized protein n=1 Tax=Adiantum capillus-veneris TaxID=13818 RepID=A0A9D4UE77_ADICA|nr:hypothetical protein GOP47_0018492 [Adiantum capillus-veneris]
MYMCPSRSGQIATTCGKLQFAQFAEFPSPRATGLPFSIPKPSLTHGKLQFIQFSDFPSPWATRFAFLIPKPRLGSDNTLVAVLDQSLASIERLLFCSRWIGAYDIELHVP